MENCLDEIIKIEKKYNLYTDSIDGCNYWMYHRYHIITSMLIDAYGMNHPYESGNKTSIIAKYFSLFYKLLKGLTSYIQSIFVRRKSPILLLPSPRELSNQDKYCFMYTGFMLAPLHPILLSNHSIGDLITIPGDNVFPFLDVIAVLEKGIYWRKKKDEVKQEIVKRLRPALLEMLGVSGTTMNIDDECDLIAKTVFVHGIRVKYFTRLLQRIHPQLVVEVVYYNNTYMLINETANNMNIKTIELQHGLVDPLHVAYRFDSDNKIPQVPNYILSFSSFWNKSFLMPKVGTELYATGFPYYEEELKRNKRKDYATRKGRIMFVSGPTEGESLSRLAVECYELLPKDEFHILYRLHPDEKNVWREAYPWLVAYDDRIEVAEPGKRSIYELFAESEFLVGVYSTVLFEGIGYGLRTYVYKKGFYESMKPLVDANYAIIFENINELIELITLNKNDQGDRTRVEEIWKENAANNIIGFIMDLLEGVADS